MAWIQLHQSVWTHRKTLVLAAHLGINRIYAAAHMAHLWTWALDNVPHGHLGDLPNAVVAQGAEWPGDPDVFVEGAIKAGYITRDEDGLHICNWDEYAGRLIEQREKSRSRMQAVRHKKQSEQVDDDSAVDDDIEAVQLTCDERSANVTRTCDERSANVTRTCDAREEKSREDNITPLLSPLEQTQFDRFWHAYPSQQRARPAEARKAFAAALADGADPERLIAAARHYAEAVKHELPKYIKFPANFIRDGTWEEYVDGVPEQACASPEHGGWRVPDAEETYRELEELRRQFGVIRDG